MTEKEAYGIFHLPQGAELSEIKKRYRQLITQAHPDAQAHSANSGICNAREINIAYSILKKKNPQKRKTLPATGDNPLEDKGKTLSWDAPVNENAYAEREILHYVKDYDDEILGNFCIARGKYLWSTEEDFPLFLLSIYNCGKRLLDEADASLARKNAFAARRKLQAELTYLLAQQFIDSTALLAELAKKESCATDGGRIFYLSAMLEPSLPGFLPPELLPAAGERLYPSAIRRHKLYLKNQSGKELGYLSFPDDRLYYIVVPLFEQKRVRVKIQAAERKNCPNQRANVSAKYLPLHLWLKLPGTTETVMPESLNLQIARLLDEYRHLIYTADCQDLQ